MITPGDFWLHCKGIVRDLDDRRQELPPGVLKQLHTQMLFILTRCTRLLQFHKSWEEEEQSLIHEWKDDYWTMLMENQAIARS
ncbi:hypothetical protein YC2023_061923 [Brassica napus]